MRISDWSSDVCSSDLDTLALPARQLHPALADEGVVAAPSAQVAQLRNEARRLGQLRSAPHVLLARLGLAVDDVVADRAVQQRGVLSDHGDLSAKAALHHLRDVLENGRASCRESV